MYDKYDRFNLNLNTIASGYSEAITLSGVVIDNRSTYITLSGLPWINNTYSQSKNSNTNETIIASCYWNANAITTQYFYGNNTATFGKNQDICNISITLRKITDNALPTFDVPLAKIIFIFDIVGVDGYKVNNVTDSRMIK